MKSLKNSLNSGLTQIEVSYGKKIRVIFIQVIRIIISKSIDAGGH